MPLSFPLSASIGQTYSSGSSTVYRWNGTYWGLAATPALVTGLTANTASVSISSSYAVTASYAFAGRKKTITKISRAGYGMSLILAEGRIYGMKASDTGYNATPQALAPNSVNTNLNRGVINAYEIEIPNETGSVADADIFGDSAYALMDNGNLYTWGNNASGQLGLGNTTLTYYPSQSNSNVVEVYTHNSNASSNPTNTRLLIKKTDGKIYGCGENSEYELGIGNNTDQTSWVELTWAGTNPLSVWNIGALAGNIFVQKSDGTIWVSGRNTEGQIGNGGTTTLTASIQVNAWLSGSGNTAYRITNMFAGHRGSADTNHFNMMLLTSASSTVLLSAGYNGNGQVGNASTTNVSVPTPPNSGLGPYNNITAAAIVGGSRTTCYIVRNGALNTWGYGAQGAGGWGSTLNITSPVTVGALGSSVLDIIPIAQGFYESGANTASPLIRTTSGYYMAGYNNSGTLGAGIAATTSNTFVKVRFPSNVVIRFISSMTSANNGVSYHAVDSENNIWSWGYNGYYGIDPIGTTNYYQPVMIQPPALLA